MDSILKDVVAFGSVILCIATMSYYIFTIMRGATKPHVLTWSVWTIVAAVVAYAQFIKFAGAGAWPTIITALLCGIVTILAFFRGEKNITKSDWVSFAVAIAAIPVWIITQDPLRAVIMVVIADGFGFYPTIRKSFNKPREEAAVQYASDALKNILSLVAMQTYSLTAILYPVFVIVANAGFLLMITIRRKQVAQS